MRVILLLQTVLLVCHCRSWFRFDVHGSDSSCSVDSLVSGGWITTGIRGSFFTGTPNTVDEGACQSLGDTNYYIDCSAYAGGTGTIYLNICSDPTCVNINTCLSFPLSAGTCTNVFGQAPYYLTGVCQEEPGEEPPAVPSLPYSVSVRDSYAFDSQCNTNSPLLRRFWYTPSACDTLADPQVGHLRDCRSGVGIQHTCDYVDSDTCGNCQPASRSLVSSACDLDSSQEHSHLRYCVNPSTKTDLMAHLSFFGASDGTCSGQAGQVESLKSNTCHDMTADGLGWVLGDCDNGMFYYNCNPFNCITSTCTSVSQPACFSTANNNVAFECAAAPKEPSSPAGFYSHYLTEENTTTATTCNSDNLANPLRVLDRVVQYSNGVCGSRAGPSNVDKQCTSWTTSASSSCSDQSCQSCDLGSEASVNRLACNTMEGMGGVSTFSCGFTCNGDYDFDGKVDVTDLAELLTSWGSVGDAPIAQDLTGDFVVSVEDLAAFLVLWGPCQ